MRETSTTASSRPARAAILLATSLLAISGCTLASPPEPTPSASPTGTPGATPTTAVQLLSYPDTPTALWTFSAEQAGVTAGSDVALYDPAQLTSFVEGFAGASPIDAGDVWITAARGRDVLPVLVGLAPESGEPLWTYRPRSGVLSNCARTVVDGALPCLVSNGGVGADARTAVVLLDPGTGIENGGFDLPFPATSLHVTGSDLVALMQTDPALYDEDGPEPSATPFRLGRFTADGDAVWAADLPFKTGGPGRGLWESVEVGESLVGVEILGSVFLLRSDTGALLPVRSGPDAFWASSQGGGLVTTRSDVEGPQVTVYGSSGAEVAVIQGAVNVPPLVVDDVGPALVAGPSSDVLLVDAETGDARTLGVTPGGADTLTAASVLGHMLLTVDDGTLLGHDTRSPDRPDWRVELVSSPRAYTDGVLLYVSGMADDGATAGGSVGGLRLEDGLIAWTMPLVALEGTGGPSLERAGEHLVVVDGPTITALVP